MKLEIHIEKVLSKLQTDVYMIGKHPDGRKFRVKPMQFLIEPISPDERIEPTMSFDENGASNFLNAMASALVESGFRAKELDATKEIEAIQGHLKDMRDIAFTFINRKIK